MCAILAAMSKGTLVFFIGILLTLVPFLGIPEDWRKSAVAAIGALLIIIGYMLRRELYFVHIDKGNGERGTDSFVETTQPLFDERELQ
jgi:heme/copper-type cytochrome/quinol oxidase subunit 4